MIPLYRLARSERPILGYPLARFTDIAARRAGLSVVDALPDHGEVIVVGADAAVTPDALSALARRPAGDRAAVDRAAQVARVDVHHVRDARARGATTIAEVLAGTDVDRLELPVARYAGAGELRHAEDVLMRGGTKKLFRGDVMGVLNRELTLPLVRPVARANIHPNTITLVGFAVMLASAVPLAIGGYGWLVLGAFLQWVSSLLDGVDGKLARLKGQATLVLFGALAIGLARSIGAVPVAAVSVVLVSGLVAAFFIGAGMRKKLVPPEHPEQLGPLVYRTIDEHRADPVMSFARATIRLTSRAGLPHIFLVAALVGALPVVFVLAAVGAQLAWMIALRIERFALAAREVRHAA
jgi:hypothetical protein